MAVKPQSRRSAILAVAIAITLATVCPRPIDCHCPVITLSIFFLKAGSLRLRTL